MKIKKNWRSLLNYKSKLDQFKNIDKKNEAFHALSKLERRMEIALDIIGLLELDHIIPAGGGYWSSPLKLGKQKCNTPTELQQFTLNTERYSGCHVCARGAMMLSTIRLGNKLEPNAYGITDGNDSTQNHFPESIYSTMENVYEDAFNSYSKPYKANSPECLANIFLQVIQREGKYALSNKTDYLKIIT